ncbi:MAG: hypothetical protein OPY06_06135, partial [Nitrosopumilus sp.]|nr:hypothetical protein [Nitrosopumilus sp.]
MVLIWLLPLVLIWFLLLVLIWFLLLVLIWFLLLVLIWLLPLILQRSMLADAAITNVAAQIENNGGKQGGNASVTLELSATAIATKIAWTESGFSTVPIDCVL